MDAAAALAELRAIEIERRGLQRRLGELDARRDELLELDRPRAPKRSVPTGAGLRALMLGQDVSRPERKKICA